MQLRLGFLDRPSGGRGAVLFPKIRVAVQDESGAVAATANPRITLTLERGGETLRTWTVPARAGVATFRNLVVDEPGRGYRLRAQGGGLTFTETDGFEIRPERRHVILMIADGWGYKHIEATERYTKQRPPYGRWTRAGMTTWNIDVQRTNARGYSSQRAWSEFAYPIIIATDSAAAASAMYTGVKTDLRKVSVAPGDTARLMTIAEIARRKGLVTGCVTTVPLSHATPGAWIGHNSDRYNGFAIADEALFGDPNTTGSTQKHKAYAGGWGPTERGTVLLAGGHPAWHSDIYVNNEMLQKILADANKPGAWRLVQRIAGKRDAAARLHAAAGDPKTDRLLGLFGGSAGNLEFRLADGTGHDPENPTLAEMTRAALTRLSRNELGFALMVEAGAVDWASHENKMNEMIGEMIGFDQAVAEVVAWVDDPSNEADWTNTLLIVTGDHECGYLTAGRGVLPDQPLGEITARTLKLEKPATNLKTRHGVTLRASWEDTDEDGELDSGETVYWVWNYNYHSNSLIPLFARGLAADEVTRRATRTDTVRGKYVDNTDVFHVMLEAMR